MLIQLAKAVKTVSLSYRLISSSVMLGALVSGLVRRKRSKPTQKILERPKDVD